MQERLRNAGHPGLSAFDMNISRAYPKHHVLPFRRQRHVLLSLDAGVWVGTERDFFPPTRRSGWVSFSSAILSKAPGGWTFEILATELTKEKPDDYRDRERNS